MWVCVGWSSAPHDADKKSIGSAAIGAERVLALTATATPSVATDNQRGFDIRDDGAWFVTERLVDVFFVVP